MQDQGENQVDLISQLYPDLYTTIASDPGQVGEKEQSKRRRRRKRKREGSDFEAKKRKLSPEQVRWLEMSFEFEHKLETDRKDRLALELGLDPRQVAIWFQNRRVRWKNKKLEDEVSKLRDENENLMVEKCELNIEVSSLKDQLSDAKKEIQRLMERLSSSSRVDNSSINSPSSSLTMDYHAHVMEPQPLGGQFELGSCFENMFYVPICDYEAPLDWVNLFSL